VFGVHVYVLTGSEVVKYGMATSRRLDVLVLAAPPLVRQQARHQAAQGIPLRSAPGGTRRLVNRSRNRPATVKIGG
jgi:hypothetical protein